MALMSCNCCSEWLRRSAVACCRSPRVGPRYVWGLEKQPKSLAILRLLPNGGLDDAVGQLQLLRYAVVVVANGISAMGCPDSVAIGRV